MYGRRLLSDAHSPSPRARARAPPRARAPTPPAKAAAQHPLRHYRKSRALAHAVASCLAADSVATQSADSLAVYLTGVATATAGLVGLSYYSSSAAMQEYDDAHSDDGSGQDAPALMRGLSLDLELAAVADEANAAEDSSTAGSDTDAAPKSGPGRRSSVRQRSASLLGVSGRPSIVARRHSIVVGSFGAGAGSVAAFSDLHEASRARAMLRTTRQRATTWGGIPSGRTDAAMPPRPECCAARERSVTLTTGRAGRGD